MQLPWSLLLLLQLAVMVVSAPFSRRWPAFNHHYRNFKPFKPKTPRFAAPIQGFSNIFQDNGISRWGSGTFPSIQGASWSRYPARAPQVQPIPLARNRYQSFPIPRPTPAPFPRRQHQFVPARTIQGGKVPTEFMTDAELHGLVCVPASSLSSALAGHQDRVTRHRDGTVTTHRTVLAGTNGGTSHSTRITSGGAGTVVETRTNSSSGVQQHRQAVERTGAGVVRSSTGSAFSDGRLGLPTFADVVTSSVSEGSNSRSRASASGYDVNGLPIPSRSASHSASSGLDMVAGRHQVPLLPLVPRAPQLPVPSQADPATQTPLVDPWFGLIPSALMRNKEPTPPEAAAASEAEEASSSPDKDASPPEDMSPELEEEASSQSEDDVSSVPEEDSASLQTEEMSSPPGEDTAPPQSEETSPPTTDEEVSAPAEDKDGDDDGDEQPEEPPEAETNLRVERKERVVDDDDDEGDEEDEEEEA